MASSLERRRALRWRWRALALWIAVFTAVSFYTLATVRDEQRKTRTEARNTHMALCTFRADLKQRAAQSRDFLREHPHGIPGIPVSVIRNGLANQQRTVQALQGLKCG